MAVLTGNKNRVAAVLAILAMVGFLAIFAALSFLPVPAGNKDFFNMGFVALIGQVGTAFGYYLGSSLGSAQKTELLAPPSASVPVPAAGPQGPAGPAGPQGPQGPAGEEVAP